MSDSPQVPDGIVETALEATLTDSTDEPLSFFRTTPGQGVVDLVARIVVEFEIPVNGQTFGATPDWMDVCSSVFVSLKGWVRSGTPSPHRKCGHGEGAPKFSTQFT
jgi:hypothetical protein